MYHETRRGESGRREAERGGRVGAAGNPKGVVWGFQGNLIPEAGWLVYSSGRTPMTLPNRRHFLAASGLAALGVWWHPLPVAAIPAFERKGPARLWLSLAAYWPKRR